jgi:hypothetical protein
VRTLLTKRRHYVEDRDRRTKLGRSSS